MAEVQPSFRKPYIYLNWNSINASPNPIKEKSPIPRGYEGNFRHSWGLIPASTQHVVNKGRHVGNIDKSVLVAVGCIHIDGTGVATQQ